MARIRSVHPGLFTDEAFVSVSPLARLLTIGIWCEAWDDGVFEWKPLSLKMRLFPADTADVPSLLAELEAADIIKRFSVEGRSYGAVRNFQKFQRPKKPNSSGILPNSLHTYVGHQANGSPPVPHQFGTGGENSPQMEDGEGVGEEKERETINRARSPTTSREGRAAPDDHADLKLTLRHAAGLEESDEPGLEDVSPILDLIAKGYSLRDRIVPVLQRKRGTKATRWSYFVPAIIEAEDRAGGIRAAPKATPAAAVWVNEGSPEWIALTRARGGKPPLKTWHDGKPGAFVRPADLQASRSAA